MRLYADDLEDLYAKLKEFDSLKLIHKGYSYDSMEELKKHVDRKYISELTIDAKQREKISLSDVEYSWPGGYLWIKISASKVYIWAKACGDKPGAIADYLREKIPWRYAWRPENWNISIAIVFGITLLLVMALLFTMVTHDDRLVFWLFPLNGAFPIVALVLLFTPIFGGSKIMLYSTGSETTFWERNSDKIKLSIFSLLWGHCRGLLNLAVSIAYRACEVHFSTWIVA